MALHWIEGKAAKSPGKGTGAPERQMPAAAFKPCPELLLRVHAGGSIEAIVRLIPLSAGDFEIMLPLTTEHSQTPTGLLLQGNVRGLCVRCGGFRLSLNHLSTIRTKLPCHVHGLLLVAFKNGRWTRGPAYMCMCHWNTLSLTHGLHIGMKPSSPA